MDPQNHETTVVVSHETTKPQNHRPEKGVTIALPTNMYIGIHNIAGRKGMTKKKVIVGMLKDSARVQMEFRQVMKELSMSLPELVQYCREGN
jgi:hypothetical protein